MNTKKKDKKSEYFKKRGSVGASHLKLVVAYLVQELDIDAVKGSMLLLGQAKDADIAVDYMFKRGVSQSMDYFLDNHVVGLRYNGRLSYFVNLNYSASKIQLLVDVELFRKADTGAIDADLLEYINGVHIHTVIHSDDYRSENTQKNLKIRCAVLGSLDVDISYFDSVRLRGTVLDYTRVVKNLGSSCCTMYVYTKNLKGTKRVLTEIEECGNKNTEVFISIPIVKMWTLLSTDYEALHTLIRLRKAGYTIKINGTQNGKSDKLVLIKRMVEIAALIAKLEEKNNYYKVAYNLFSNFNIGESDFDKVLNSSEFSVY